MREVSLLKPGFIGVSIEHFAGNVKHETYAFWRNSRALYPRVGVSRMEQP